MDWHKCSENFVRIVENKSFAEAARRRFTSSSALSKQVNWLEAQLGVQLLQRTTRHLELTESGTQFYHKAKHLLEEWYELKESLRNQSDEPRGILNIGLSVILGNNYIVPLLPLFLSKHPFLKVNLATLTYPLTMSLEALDVCISHKAPEFFSDSLNYRVLGELCFFVFASPAYLKQYGTPRTPDELKQHNCLLNTGQNVLNRWDFEQGSVPVEGNLTADNGRAIVKAAAAGLGLIFTSPFSVTSIEDQGSLVKIMPEYHSAPCKIYAYYPKRKRVSLKTELFLGHIEETLNFPK